MPLVSSFSSLLHLVPNKVHGNLHKHTQFSSLMDNWGKGKINVRKIMWSLRLMHTAGFRCVFCLFPDAGCPHETEIQSRISADKSSHCRCAGEYRAVDFVLLKELLLIDKILFRVDRIVRRNICDLCTCCYECCNQFMVSQLDFVFLKRKSCLQLKKKILHSYLHR